MMKKIKVTGLALISATISMFSQNTTVNQVIIANGGQFEFGGPPYNDRATIGAYLPSSSSYTIFDTIESESVNGIVLDNNIAYLGAGDTILKYDIDTKKLLNKKGITGIKNVYKSNSYVFITRFDYALNPLAIAIDKNNLNTVYNFDSLYKNVGSVLQVGDSIYIASNIKGTIDQLPPWGVFLDTLGVISVFNANNGNFVRYIHLDTAGAGISDLFLYNNFIYGICKERGNLMKYDINNGNINYVKIGIKKFVELYGTTLFGIFGTDTLASYDIVNNQFIDNYITNKSAVAISFDSINFKFYLNVSDYISYGKTYILNLSGFVLDSIDVGISPEAMAIDYRTSTGRKILRNSESVILYPNPAKEILNIYFNKKSQIKSISISDLTGKEVIKKESFLQVSGVKHINIDISNLRKGIYFINIITQNNNISRKIIKF